MASTTPVALVTGAAKRVGRAIALELADAGYDIGIHYHRSHSAAEETAARVKAYGRRAVLIPADLGDSATWPTIIDRTVGALGRLDALINNASVFDPSGQDDLKNFDHQRWEHIYRVNTLAPTALCHYARVHLAAGDNGCIVNLCDVATERPWPSHLAYCSSKAALINLTKGLARAMAPDVRVNAISPGIAIFPEEYSQELRRRLVARVPLGRPGTPEDVARTVCFLVLAGTYITGQVLCVDGGSSIV